MRSSELRDEWISFGGVLARARFVTGTAKACAPPDAYDVNALVFLLADARVRGGDLERNALLEGLDTDANGDAEPAKASKPVRLDAVGDVGIDGGELDLPKEDCAKTGAGEGDGDTALKKDVGLDRLPKMFCPFTDANGEFVEAYAIKPLCN